MTTVNSVTNEQHAGADDDVISAWPETTGALGDPFGDPGPDPRTARETVTAMAEAGLFDDLYAQIDVGGLALTGQGGFIPEMIKAVLERGLRAELSDHLGYEAHARSGNPNSRNGSTPKRVLTEAGPVELATPRDRAGSF